MIKIIIHNMNKKNYINNNDNDIDNQCDIDINKICDNCMRCIGGYKSDYAEIIIDEIITDKDNDK